MVIRFAENENVYPLMKPPYKTFKIKQMNYEDTVHIQTAPPKTLKFAR